ncbi:hypothetical protein EXIGLDRAFT_774162 [Exidia glandulosa HHB12029]|uniref:Uncharacterized protein n=1 Tax=Exidia glandulosa HHB12029 TaxID=1314781 RepID=A0A165EGM0_EXIGL|nr:hypothetical protein EXIGLDRAFT_774162 [Exidia glandulosa HHB12029]
MVGAINAPDNGTGAFSSFMSAAMALTALPSQTAGALTGVGAMATASPSPLASAAASGSPSSAAGTGSGTAAAPSSTTAGATKKTGFQTGVAMLGLLLGAVVVLA